jgi:hypothetical protein
MLKILYGYASLLAILLLITISSCSAMEPELNDNLVEAYPVGNQTTLTNENETSYPSPLVTENDVIIEPTLDNTLGIVIVKILLNEKPVPETLFFLADVLKSEEGLEIATSLDRSTAPRAFSDEEGLVRFINLQPGRYGLILYEGMNSYLLLNPNDGQAILVTVDSNNVIDLGTMRFFDLPIE